MNPAEIEVSYGKGNRVLQIFKFLGKPQGEAREPPVEQPQAQMSPVDIGRTYLVEEKWPEHMPLVDCFYAAWLIPPFRRFGSFWMNELFGDLAVAGFTLEHPFDFILEQLVTVGGELKWNLHP